MGHLKDEYMEDLYEGYITRETHTCPKCGVGTIIREKDNTPGFKCVDWFKCDKCGYYNEDEFEEICLKSMNR